MRITCRRAETLPSIITGGILQLVIWTIAMALLLASVRPEAKQDGAVRIVDYGMTFRILNIVFLLVLAWMIRSVATGDPTATVTDWRVPAFFGSILTPCVLEVFRHRVAMGDDSVTFRSAWHATITVGWLDITAVDHSDWLQCHILELNSTRHVFLPDTMSGKEELLDQLRLRRGFHAGGAS